MKPTAPVAISDQEVREIVTLANLITEPELAQPANEPQLGVASGPSWEHLRLKSVSDFDRAETLVCGANDSHNI